MADPILHVRESGFEFPERMIHLIVGGSELHGAKVHGTDDLDIYGLYVEAPELVLGLESLPHFVWSTAGNDRRKKGRGKKGQRPEIEQKYGYDVKAAMHTLRLLYECKELMLEGEITLPRPERDFLIKVRTGKYSMEKVLAMAEELFAACEQAAKASTLPEKVDRKAVSRLITAAYRKMWDACENRPRMDRSLSG